MGTKERENAGEMGTQRYTKGKGRELKRGDNSTDLHSDGTRRWGTEKGMKKKRRIQTMRW